MKKIIVSFLFVISAMVSTMAQNTVVNNPENRAYFGIRVGGEVTSPGEVYSDFLVLKPFKDGGGVELGGIYNIPVAANFYLEPGLKFYYNTYSMKAEFGEEFGYNELFKSIYFRKFGMRVPVMAGYHFDFAKAFKLYLFTGPELEVGFSAEECLKQRSNDVVLSESIYGEDGGMNRVNLLWDIGVGVSYRHIYFGITGSIGMLNMLSDSNMKFHEDRFTFSLGYNF